MSREIFSGTATFGTATVTSVGGPDIFLAKYNTFGEVVWVRSAGGPSNGLDIAKGLAVDSAGNVVVTGEFPSMISFESINLTSAGQSDAFVARYDPAGNLLWARQGGGFGNDSGVAVAVDAQGNTFVTGFITFTYPPFGGSIESTFGPFRLTAQGARDFFVAKYDIAGNVLWALRDGGDKDDYSTGIAVDPIGDVYVTGKFRGYWVPAGIIKETFLSKYDNNGRAIRGRQTDGEEPRVAVDPLGRVYVATTFPGRATFQNTTLVSQGGSDIAVVRYDSDGNFRWLKQAGGQENEVAQGLAVSGSGDVFLTGSFGGPLPLDSHALNADGFDLFVAKLGSPETTMLGPVITTQPESQTVLAGGNVQFRVFASGSPPLRHQWQFNGVNLSGATNAMLFLADVASSLSGEYQVVVSNTHGSVTSAMARLTVTVVLPAFTVLPTGRTLQSGSDVTFNVAATGRPFPSFQWQFNGTNLPGATNTTLNLSNITPAQAGPYNVVASNAVGAVPSPPATLIIIRPFEFLPEFTWAQMATVNNNGNFISGPSVAVDKDGNLYLTGAFTGEAKFGNTTITTVSPIAIDTFLIKLDKAGQILWSRKGGGALPAFARGLAVDKERNVYTAGQFSIISKYDPEGNPLWAHRFESVEARIAANQSGSAIALDHQGNAFVTGSFHGSIRIGGTLLTGSPSSFDVQMFVAKFDSAGNAIWARQTKGESSLNFGQSIAVDAAGNVYVTGAVGGSADFGGTRFIGNGFDVFVAKYDNAGNLLWVKSGGGRDNQTGLGVAVDSVGRVWVAGEFRGTAAFASVLLNSVGQSDAFIVQYDRDGNVNWARSAGGGGADAAFSLAVDNNDNAYVNGLFNGTAKFGDTELLHRGTNAFFVAKIDGAGEFVWAKKADGQFAWPKTRVSEVGSSHSDGGHGLALDTQGNAYLTGLFNGMVSFDGRELVAGQRSDLFLVKLTPSNPPPPPVMTVQPRSLKVMEGASALFSVAASSATSVKYQWRFNGIGLPGATNATLLLPFVQEQHIGSYHAEIRNAGGAVTSAIAQLQVFTPTWVTTLAGSGTAGHRDATGETALFASPNAVAVGPDGSVYVADTLNHRIRRISAAGDVGTVAGTGVAGFSDGPGISAQFNSPLGLVVNSSGEILVADAGNYRIRKIEPGRAHTVITVAGSGQRGLVDGSATAATFDRTAGIAIDAAGNLFVSEFANVIRKIAPNGDVMTFAGSGFPGNADGAGRNAQFKAPTGLAIAMDGSLWVADSGNHLIRKITPNGTVSTLAGSGVAGFADGVGAAAQFNSPKGITVNEGGDLFVADTGNHVIRKVSPTGKVTTLAGTGNAGYATGDGAGAQFNGATGVALDHAGNLILADTNNHRIRIVALGRPELTVARAGSNLVFSWPLIAGEFVLESADAVGPSAAWDSLGVQPTGAEMRKRVILPVEARQKFFRLRRP